MITAWDVYWVMQLDRVGDGFGVTGCMSLIFGLIGTFFCLAHKNSIWGTEAKTAKGLLPYMKGLVLLGLFNSAVSVFLPSSKTAAAMIVLPAITSDTVVEAVAPEARELYTLAKDALRGLGEKETQPVEKNKD